MSTKRSLRVLISSGHTGGHFFPALSFAKTFKAKHPEAEIHILLGRIPAFAETLISNCHFNTRRIEIPLRPKFFSFKMISFLLQYVFVYIRTFRYLLNLKPSLVVGFGSYASIPSVLCASMLRMPTLLHEQNFMAGRANRLLSYWANKVAVSFPETQGIPSKNKMAFTGYPLREEFLKAIHSDVELLRDRSKKYSGHVPSKFKILVFGGSQGAQRLNELFLQAIERFGAEEKNELAVKHIVGGEDLNRIQLLYQRSGVQAEVSAFSYTIAEDYRSADLVVSRSGAGTVFELIAARRPAILIPYPHAYAHQRLNADYLVKRRAAILILEENLSPEVLADAILDLKRNPAKRMALGVNLKRFDQPNASEDLVQLAWELACKKN